jgi:hypothetical protein
MNGTLLHDSVCGMRRIHTKELGTKSEMSCKRVINPQEGEDFTEMNVWSHIYITFSSLRLQTATASVV